MSIFDHIHLNLSNSEETAKAGHSLASSLYASPTTITLEGPLGAGKTTFVQGLAKGMGIDAAVNSPTFALEQRYIAPSGKVLSHIDLYRLGSAQARKLLIEGIEEHADVRCIEWADRVDEDWLDAKHIHAAFAETPTGRTLDIRFHDMDLPSEDDIEQWRNDNLLPAHIGKHCDAVSSLATKLADLFIGQGIIVRRKTLRLAGRLHDLLRVVDLKPGSGHVEWTPTPAQEARWAEIRKQFPHMTHEEACAQFMEQQRYPALARIIRTHGVDLPPTDEATIEQKLLYYADKRVKNDEVVSLDERFDDFAKRYGNGIQSDQGKIWHTESKALERALFGGSPPSFS